MEETVKRRTTTIEDLGHDTMVEILLLLPLSSIIQCSNVCKRWRSLITSCPLFLTKTVNLVCTLDHGIFNYIFLEKGQRRKKSTDLEHDLFNDFPMRGRFGYQDHLSCNGLLFSYFFSRRKADLSRCYISNPLTKECVRLPNPTIARRDSLCGLAFETDSGIINSSCNNVASFKIVMAHSIKTGKHKALYRFEIYSSDRRRWQLLKTASKPHDHHRSLRNQSAIYCNRILYWHCPGMKQALTFNLETETSGHLDLPRDHDEIYVSKLAACAGQLHYIRRHFNRCRLSVLKMLMSGEWMILHDVDLQGAMRRYLNRFPSHTDNLNFKPVGISCEEEYKVLLNDDYKRIVSYDLKRDVFEIVLEKDFILPQMLFQYIPTNLRIIHKELQHGFRTKRSKQFKQLYDYARNLLGWFKL